MVVCGDELVTYPGRTLPLAQGQLGYASAYKGLKDERRILGLFCFIKLLILVASVLVLLEILWKLSCSSSSHVSQR